MRDQTSAEMLAAACIVIPTYNERENIARLVEALRALSPALRIIVIDDGSPDGTGAVADGLAARWAPLQVIHRAGKGGRGSACLAGFAAALEDPEVLYFVEMDADFSHDPRELPETLEALRGADVVIRSRYEPTSSIVDWGLARRVFSRLANIFARRWLGMPLSDFTNGYRAYTRRAVLAIEPDAIQSTGYIVLSEIAYQLGLKGFRFAQLPTLFVNRRRGESNLGPREICSAMRGIIRLPFAHGGEAAGRLKAAAFLLFALALFLFLYLAFPDKVFVFDGVFFSVAIERHVVNLRSVLLNPHHLLFLAAFMSLRDMLVALGHPVEGYALIQRVNACAGALGVALYFRLLARLTRDQAVSAAAALLFGVSYSYWSRATEGQVYLLMTVGALATVWAACALVERPGRRRALALAALWLLAALFHAADAVLLPVVAAALWIAAPQGRRWKYLAAPLAAVLAAAGLCALIFGIRTPAALRTFLATDFGGVRLAGRTAGWSGLLEAFFSNGGLSLPARAASAMRLFFGSLIFCPWAGAGPVWGAGLFAASLAAAGSAVWAWLDARQRWSAGLLASSGLAFAFLDSFWNGGMFFWAMPAAAFIGLGALCWARLPGGAGAPSRRKQLGAAFFLALALGGWNLRAAIVPQSRLESNAGYARALFVRDHTVSTCWIVMSGLGFPNSKVYLTRFARRSNRALEYFVDSGDKKRGLASFTAFLQEAMEHGIPVYALSDLIDDPAALEGAKQAWGTTPEEIRDCFGAGRFVRIAAYDERLRLYLFIPQRYRGPLFAGLAFNILDLNDIARIQEAGAVMANLGAEMTAEERARTAGLLEESNYGALLAFSGMAPYLDEAGRGAAQAYARSFQRPPTPQGRAMLPQIYALLGARKDRF